MFVEACAVGQPGQRIATRHEGDALDGALALGDVLAEREQELRLAIGAVDRKTGNRADALGARRPRIRRHAPRRGHRAPPDHTHG